MRSPLLAMQKKLLQLPHAQSQDYGEQMDDILALLRGTYRAPEGDRGACDPGRGCRRPGLDPWQQRRAERRGCAGATGCGSRANYHVSPATVLEAADGYRAAFQPSGELDRSLRQRVGRRRRAPGRGDGPRAGHRIRPVGSQHSQSVRARSPSRPRDEAREHAWIDEDRDLVTDRVETQFVGSPNQVADQLEQLQEATGADELIITTITHDHADRVRSYELLAQEWERR